MRRWRLGESSGRLLLFVLALTALLAGAARADVRAVCSEAQVDALLKQLGEQRPRQTVIDKTKFYALAKSAFSIYQKPGNHYVGTDSLLDYWNSRRELTDLRWLAYIMATSYHETARRMMPVRETLASTDAAVVKILARSSHTKNKTYWQRDGETGQHYYGRGHVQLTWRANYALADKRLGRVGESDKATSFEWSADLVLDPKDSVEILFDGMIYGWYTQKHCLPYYFDPAGVRPEDWKNARRIVNVLDRWQTIQGYGQTFLSVLQQSEVEKPFTPGEEEPETPEPEAPETGEVTDGQPQVEQPEEPQGPTAEERLEIAEDTIASLGRQNEGLKAQIARMSTENKSLSTEIDTLRQERSTATRRISELEAQVAAVAESISTLQTQNQELTQRVEDGAAERTRLHAAAAEANAQLIDASAKLTQAESALAVAEARATSLGNRVDALAAEEQRLRQRLAEAETKLRELQEEANKSWWGRMLGN